jgi:hypothetical protein
VATRHRPTSTRPAIGSSTRAASRRTGSSRAPQGRLHHADPEAEEQKGVQQEKILFDAAAQGLGTEAQQYDLSAFISGVRQRVDRWRELPAPNAWRVTPETARLLRHWRGHRFGDIRPFFCQVEAVETAIWLTEVAPTLGRESRRFLDQIDTASEGANPGLVRLALKLATGAGKTAVMAMIIAWQTVNAVRRPGSRIRDRLRVLQPNDQREVARCPRDQRSPRGKAGGLDPLSLPVELQTALEAAVRALREDLRGVAAGRHRSAAVLQSSSATTRRRSWSTTSSPASPARTRTAPPRG